MAITHRKAGDPLPDWDPLSRGPLILFGMKQRDPVIDLSPKRSPTPEEERGIAEQRAWEQHRASQRRPKAPNKT